jgi:hypothetical protein
MSVTQKKINSLWSQVLAKKPDQADEVFQAQLGKVGAKTHRFSPDEAQDALNDVIGLAKDKSVIGFFVDPSAAHEEQVGFITVNRQEGNPEHKMAELILNMLNSDKSVSFAEVIRLGDFHGVEKDKCMKIYYSVVEEWAESQ